jgi:two-component system, OmpR family, response regulator ArlR
MRILLAEDEVELSRALVTILKYSGYETDPAFNGKDAFCMALENHCDAFVLDIMMPKLSGLEVLQGLRKKNIKTPAIMLKILSGKPTPSDVGWIASLSNYLF